MDLIFCTTFDSNYLDKGLVLYDSMVKCMEEFKLYVFAFDSKCEEILKKENLKNVVIVGMNEFESPELLEVKAERTRAEYCWTCSSWSVKYVLEKYGEKICTYIDADMMFFSSPQCIFDEMHKKKCSTIIVPHRFRSEEEEKKAHDEVGSFCVEFNTFVNDENGKTALDWWAYQCLKWCYYAVPGTTEWYGDQKYLNVFPEKFEGVMVCDHYGVGLAPWNTCLVDSAGENDGVPYIRVIGTDMIYPVIIYHFESVSFLSKHILHAPSGMRSKILHHDVYDVYVRNILNKRQYIEAKYRYKISKTRRVVTNNLLIKLYHKYISPIRRIKSIKDIYWVKNKGENNNDNAK